jgi:hypothetical protein
VNGVSGHAIQHDRVAGGGWRVAGGVQCAAATDLAAAIQRGEGDGVRRARRRLCAYHIGGSLLLRRCHTLPSVTAKPMQLLGLVEGRMPLLVRWLLKVRMEFRHDD